MKGLKGLRFLIVGGLIFFIGCGGYQGSSSIKELETDKPSAQSQVIGTLSDTKGSDTVESADEVELLIKKGEIEEKEKILVDQFETDGDDEVGARFTFRWCGSNAFVVKKENEGIEWIDILEKKRLKITENKDDRLLDSSLDGRWIIYTDSKNSPDAQWKYYNYRKNPKWNPECTIDVYRYEVDSGKKEKIGVMRTLMPVNVMLSPDEKKIFLGGQVEDNIEMSEPKWEKLYFKKKDWDAEWYAVWFQDSSGIITNEENDEHEERIGVEIFGHNGWDKTFKIGVKSIDSVQTCRDKKFYFRGWVPNEWLLYEGRITENKELTYKKILEFNIDNDAWYYVVLPEGDIVLWEKRDKWIRCVSPEQMKTKWVVKVEEWSGNMKVSPDRKWLLFSQEIGQNDEEGRYNGKIQVSHYIVKLKKEVD